MRVAMLLVPAAVSVALLAGCTSIPTVDPTPAANGLEDLDGDAILDRVTAALTEAGSFRVVGTTEVDGEVVEVDAVYAGDELEGSFRIGDIPVDVLTVADDGTYLTAGDALWGRLLAADLAAFVQPLLAGRYLKIPTGSDRGLIPSPDDFLEPDGVFTKDEVTTVDGTPAITLVGESGELRVWLVGEPYPIDVVSDVGTLAFLDIGADVTVEAPPAENVLDLASLVG